MNSIEENNIGMIDSKPPINPVEQLDPVGYNEYIITAKDWEDETLYNELETEGIAPDGTNITRSVLCACWRENSRNTHYWLTQAEVDQLKNDPRIIDIQPHIRYLNIRISSDGLTQSSAFSKNVVPDSAGRSHVNWGLLESTLGSNISGWGYNASNFRNNSGHIVDQSLTRSDPITLDTTGKNVDVIICDFGPLVVNHPEFAKNADGTGGSRVIEYDWYQHAPTIFNRTVTGTFQAGTDTYSNFSVWYPQEAPGRTAQDMISLNAGTWSLHDTSTDAVIAVLSNYGPNANEGWFILDRRISSLDNLTINVKLKLTNPTPYNYNTFASNGNTSHSNHVAGTAAGNRQGWAKDANIYSISYNSPYDSNLSTNNPWTTSSGVLFDVTVFDFIREFHKNKPINPTTSIKNPTIVNMSWTLVSYFITLGNGFTGLRSVNYRGTTKNWTITEIDSPQLLLSASTSVQDQWRLSPKSRILSGNKKVADFIDEGRGNIGNKIYTTGTTSHNGSKILSKPNTWKQDAGIAVLWSMHQRNNLTVPPPINQTTNWYGQHDVTVQGPCTVRVTDWVYVLDYDNYTNNDATATINVTITNTSNSTELYNNSSTGMFGETLSGNAQLLIVDDKVILPDNVVYRIRFTHSATQTVQPPINSLYYQNTAWVDSYQSSVYVLYDGVETAAATVTEIPYVQPDKTGYTGYTFTVNDTHLSYPFPTRFLDIRSDGYTTLTIPFNVTVFGQSYSTVYFSNNGMSFGHEDATLCGLKSPLQICKLAGFYPDKYINRIDPLDTGGSYDASFPNRPMIKFIHNTAAACLRECYYNTTGTLSNRVFTVYLSMIHFKLTNSILQQEFPINAWAQTVSISFYENDPSRIDIHTGSGNTANYSNYGNMYARSRNDINSYNYDNPISREYGGRDSAFMALNNNYSINDNYIASSDRAYYDPVQYSVYDADIEDAQKEGIIFVAAAGNDNRLIDAIGGTDYNNNYVTTSSSDFSLPPGYLTSTVNSGTVFYNRQSSPTRVESKSLGGSFDLNTIVVGATNNTSTGQRAYFSNYGPAVTLWAPGVSIMSSTTSLSVSNQVLGNSPYIGYAKYKSYPQDPRSDNYYLQTMRGTSMASPQVCGVLACALERYPWMTQTDAVEYIKQTSRKNYMYDSATPMKSVAVNSIQSFGTAGLGGANNYFLQYTNERPSSTCTWPKTNYWLRKSSGQVYPRTSRKRYK